VFNGLMQPAQAQGAYGLFVALGKTNGAANERDADVFFLWVLVS